MIRLKEILFSMFTTVILLTLFGASIAYATFIESDRGTAIAKELIYNARWFEVLLVLLIINLLGSIFKYNLVNRRKWSVLLFHLAFIFILMGAAITRYFGYEGIIHLREGERMDRISTDQTVVRIVAERNVKQYEKTIETKIAFEKADQINEKLDVGDKTITVQSESFISNGIETIVPDTQGKPALSLFVMSGMNQTMDIILMKNESSEIDQNSFSFGEKPDRSDVTFTMINNELYFSSKKMSTKMSMMEKSEASLMPGLQYPAEEKTIYRMDNLIFVLKAFLPNARKTVVQAPAKSDKMDVMKQGKDAIVFQVNDGNIRKSLSVFNHDNLDVPSTCTMQDTKVSIYYGKNSYKLPFSIHLRDFQLDRYDGSESPSSYASEITVIDKEKNTQLPFRIYMNNILNYRGYRFFQSSYDQDERGTVLSVSHDYWGTFITYFGYLLMVIGMVFTLVNKNSRFRTVMKLSKELQQKRRSSKAAILSILLLVSSQLISANNLSRDEHLKNLSSLLVQDEAQGRIEPLNTFASDILRKISKQNSYRNMTAVEVLLNVVANPTAWQNEALVKVANDQLAKELGAVNGYVSFNQLIDFENNNQYRLKEKVEATYQKEPTARTKYDKEIINVDERINILYRILSGDMLAIFPIKGNTKGKWQSIKSDQTSVHNGCRHAEGDANMNGHEMIKNGEMNGVCPHHVKSKSDNYAQLFASYLNEVNGAYESGDWTKADQELTKMKDLQKINGRSQIPTQSKIDLETQYNEINVFGKLAIAYLLFGFVLLILHLINIFKYNQRLEFVLNYSIIPSIVLFAIYTIGLSIRWYISDHAPWSNGYETMVFVGWASSLSGLIFAKKSPITLAITAILSAIALFVAGMSWMNPEITNLVPVLKSYWLIIHVAIITSSYGFLAMGALLGLLNLILMTIRTPKNSVRLSDSIQEISYIIEMALIIGLIMLTIGSFIGGVWANESWGRYWGWDPKETWALVSILVYTSILHLRNIPKANNQFVLSSLALIGFSTIVMTFFGVNYYLSGMHSYGQGVAPSIPFVVYLFLLAIFVLIFFAYQSEYKNSRK